MKRDAGKKVNNFIFWHGLRRWHGFLGFVFVVALKFRHLNCEAGRS